jgi:hypothetical protein
MKDNDNEDKRKTLVRLSKAFFLSIEQAEDPDQLRDTREFIEWFKRQQDMTALSLYKTSGYSLSYISECLGISKQALYTRLLKLKRYLSKLNPT